MATVKEITQDIKATYGSSFVNATQAGNYLGMGKNKRGEFLAELPFCKTGKERKYFAGDIAKHMAAMQTYRPFGASR